MGKLNLSRSFFRLSLVMLVLGASIPVYAVAPVVDSFSASAMVVAPGDTITLMVEAHDPDCATTCTSGCGQTIRADGCRSIDLHAEGKIRMGQRVECVAGSRRSNPLAQPGVDFAKHAGDVPGHRFSG